MGCIRMRQWVRYGKVNGSLAIMRRKAGVWRCDVAKDLV